MLPSVPPTAQPFVEDHHKKSHQGSCCTAPLGLHAISTSCLEKCQEKSAPNYFMFSLQFLYLWNVTKHIRWPNKVCWTVLEQKASQFFFIIVFSAILVPKAAQHGAAEPSMPAQGKTLRMYVKGWLRRGNNNLTASFEGGQLLDLLTVSPDYIWTKTPWKYRTESGTWGATCFGKHGLASPNSHKGAHEAVLWSGQDGNLFTNASLLLLEYLNCSQLAPWVIA